MKNLILAVIFCCTAITAQAKTNSENIDFYESTEIETLNNVTSNYSDTCTITVRGEDEWGCAYTHTYVYQGDISFQGCQELGNAVKLLYVIFM